MINPFSGTKLNMDTVDEIIFNYIELNQIRFTCIPDKRDIFSVIFEYSFDDWKTILTSDMKFCTTSYCFYSWIDFNNNNQILYRFKIFDIKGGKPRFIDNESSNFILKLPDIQFENVIDYEKNIGCILSEGKIISTGFSSSSITPWSLGHRSIISDIRNARLESFINLHSSGEELKSLAIVMNDRVSEYFTPPVESTFGEKKAYLDRINHPYILPFSDNIKPEIQYLTLKRSERTPLVKIVEQFEKVTKHPIIWITNSGTVKNNFKKPENECEIFFNFLNSYTDCLFFENLKITKTGNCDE
ncbi:hypothetical protein KAJ27_13305 [bacterium]|nr:hypothetical protein [bacterium]